MSRVSPNIDESNDATSARAEALFNEHQDKIHKRTDRMFAGLMVFQWLAGIVAALVLSPKTWNGAESQIHVHVWAAVFIGGAITSLPVFLACAFPGRVETRQAIAIGQMLTSALLIHLTGGRIETHFHVFGSLAFLAFYRDWRVLLTATIIVAADHFLRGTFWPQSVFGVLTSSPWRWIEHAGWVIFEDLFLVLSIQQSLEETRMVAERQAKLEAINEGIEKLVHERTRELEESHKQLIETSRKAGMAEVATGVLHNVGNVLNSVNVSTSLMNERIKRSKVPSLRRLSGLLNENQSDLGTFLTADPRGKLLPTYVDQLAESFAAEQRSMEDELEQLQKNVEHIKDIVVMQQSYAKVSGVSEIVKLSDLVEDCLRMNAEALQRYGIKIEKQFGDVPSLNLEKHKVLQILVNLIRNAQHACNDSNRKDKRITVSVRRENDKAQIAVSDNGIGISRENLTRIFVHGFTTRRNGHGFGLHSGALAAKEMGGALIATSDGPGLGANFTLELPIQL